MIKPVFKFIKKFKFQGFYFCACHNLISRWAPPSEKGIFIASLFGSSLGTAFTFPLMGFITNNYSWKIAFYVTAIITLIISLLWFHVVADSPDKHISITHAERNLIEESLGLNVISRREFPPVSEMFKSKPFYALLWLHFSDVWGIYFILTSAPMFLSQVLKYDLKDVGMISSLPYIIRMASAIFFGGIGDFLWSQKIMSVTRIRKVFCIFCESFEFLVKFEIYFIFFLAHIIPGIILFGFCFIENDPQMCILLITVALGLNGAATLTSAANAQDLSPIYAGSAFGIINFFATMSGFLSPMVVSFFTRYQVGRF